MKADQFTVGSYLATRLEQAGLKHYFTVPGDYNLALLDEILKNPQLKMINCCNELNAGYAADGYARAHGLSALVVTYSVGGLSAINAVAGAYAEDLPMIVISGAPGSDAEGRNQILHHTIGKVNFHYVKDIFAKITAESVTIKHPENAPYLIDHAILTALNTKKPVYIEIACNISTLPVAPPAPMQLISEICKSDPQSLESAVKHAASLLNAAVKPALVAGVKLRSCQAIEDFEELINASHYAVAVMPNAKGFISEQNPNYIGVYWGPVSTPACGEVIESSDLYLFAGPLFTDYTTTGYSALINPKKLILAGPDSVQLPGQVYNRVFLRDFLAALAKKIKPNKTSLETFKRIRGEAPAPSPSTDGAPLTTRRLFSRIEEVLTGKNALIVETGDSWFNGNHLKLPKGCGYEIQMQYGSIGWSVGATLGYALATQKKNRVIALIGDGSFQLTAQEVSTMIRYNLNPIIILINNGGYTIEVEIHDGPYNNIKNWEYSNLIQVFNAKDGQGWSAQVKTEQELVAALKKALKYDHLCLIEVIIDRNDCNKNLLQWGSRVAANNSQPPKV